MHNTRAVPVANTDRFSPAPSPANDGVCRKLIPLIIIYKRPVSREITTPAMVLEPLDKPSECNYRIRRKVFPARAMDPHTKVEILAALVTAATEVAATVAGGCGIDGRRRRRHHSRSSISISFSECGGREKIICD